MEEVRYKIGEFAKKVNVTPKTLRAWDKSGKLVAQRTEGGEHFGQRYYTEEQVEYVIEKLGTIRCPHCGKKILRY